jgi:hypothetical protein
LPSKPSSTARTIQSKELHGIARIQHAQSADLRPHLAVPLIVLCFFLEGKLKISEFARWVALWIFFIAR